MWYDVVVIGGGINGCGWAADAALRGLSVLLCEQGDLAAHTSSKSSQLIRELPVTIPDVMEQVGLSCVF